MTVYFRACGDIQRAPTPRSRADVMLVERIARATGLEISVEASVDYEDWMEPACLLDQAIASGVEIRVLPRERLQRAVTNPLATIAGRPCRDILLGRQLERDPMDSRYFDFGWPVSGETRANHYPELETFHARAGRRIALADMPGDRAAAGDRRTVFARGLSSTSLGAAMAAIAPGTVFVKHVYPAKALPLLTYELDAGFTEDRGERMFLADTEYHFARFEGDPAALLVQERITMTHETRFFVIGGVVVSGAACIEYHTPQQRASRSALLPPIFELGRNSGEMDDRGYVERKATASRLVDFAFAVAAEISAEAPELQDYALDVALGADGVPLVIELNPVSSSGLYASDPARIWQAILARAEEAPHRTPEPWDPADFAGPAPEAAPFPGLTAVRATSVPCRETDGAMSDDLIEVLEEVDFEE